jgi:Ca2+-binding RTX toxin-like protein
MAASVLIGSPTRSRGLVLGAAIALVLTAGLLAGCGPAHGTVRVEGNGGLVFTAAAGKANDVTVRPSGGEREVLVRDLGDTITPGEGCTSFDPNTARCSNVHGLALVLKDGNDEASNNTAMPASATVPDGRGIIGGPGNDVLDGGSGADRLAGDAGDDTLSGNGHDDVLRGHDGTDTLNGNRGSDIIIGHEGTDTFNGGDGDDHLNEGESFADTDVLDADTFNGGPGHDGASYFTSSLSVRVDLDGVADDGQTNEGDNVTADVEDVSGGQEDDTLVGSVAGNRLDGRDGDDRLVEGTTSADADAFDADIYGGDNGVDTVTYEFATANVRVDLDNVADDGRQATPVSPAEGDNVRPDVENVTGGAGNDSLFGNAVANILTGNAGADFISADAGDDTLRGNAGLDPLDGGEGTDDCDVGPAGPVDGGSEVNCET